MFSIFKKSEPEVILQDLNEEQLSEVAGGFDRDSHNRREEHRHRHHHRHQHHQTWTHHTRMNSNGSFITNTTPTSRDLR